jgi:hypothetical protein
MARPIYDCMESPMGERPSPSAAVNRKRAEIILLRLDGVSVEAVAERRPRHPRQSRGRMS